MGRLIPNSASTFGDRAPDFRLPAVSGGKVSLSQYLNKMNVVLSFVPAPWTPVCSDQWPGYNIVKYVFDQHDAVLLGITVDNIPTLFAWTNHMVTDGGNLWFPLLSDFWPHGAVADKYGVLRSDGVSERATFRLIRRVSFKTSTSMTSTRDLLSKELSASWKSCNTRKFINKLALTIRSESIEKQKNNEPGAQKNNDQDDNLR
jgi:peroxiredoxin